MKILLFVNKISKWNPNLICDWYRKTNCNTNKCKTPTELFFWCYHWPLFFIPDPQRVPVRRANRTELKQICSSSLPHILKGEIHRRPETDQVNFERMEPQRTAVDLWEKAEPQIRLRHPWRRLRYSPGSCWMPVHLLLWLRWKSIHRSGEVLDVKRKPLLRWHLPYTSVQFASFTFIFFVMWLLSTTSRKNLREQKNSCEMFSWKSQWHFYHKAQWSCWPPNSWWPN